MANDKDFILKNAIEVGGPTNITLGTITSGTVDLSTGNYFAETLAANTTYTFSNPGDVQSFQMEVTGGAVTTDNVGDLSLVGSFNIGTASGAGANSRGIYVKPDGTKFWMSARNATVYAFSMSTAWDVTTASYDSVSFSTSSQDGDPQGIYFKSDGTKMYIAGSDTNDIFEYNLSTAWNISTASYSTNFAVTSANFSMTVSFSGDGSRMYVTDSGTDRVYAFTLSTPWSISTASSSTNFSYASQNTDAITTVINSNGTKMYMMAFSSASVYEYSLSTAYSPSSASLTATGTASTNGDDIHFDTATSNFFIQDGGTLTQYTMQTGASIAWPASVQWSAGVAPITPAIGETDIFTFVTDDTGTSYIGLQTADNLS